MKRLQVIGAVVLAVACGKGNTDAVGPVVRDSAGITIVENDVPRSDPPWVVDSAPVVDIGADQDDPHQLFGSGDLPIRLRDGRVLVGSRGSGEIRVFDSTGRWLANIGRKGDGPGEFSSLGVLLTGPGDTLLAYDYGSARLSLFAPDGRFLKAWRLEYPGPSHPAHPVALLAGGLMLARSGTFSMPGMRSGVSRDTARIYTYTPDGKPGPLRFQLPDNEALVQATSQTVTVSQYPFGRSTWVIVAGDKVYAGTGDSFELRAYDLAGRLERVVRRRHTLAPVTQADISGFMTNMTNQVEGLGPGYESMKERIRRMYTAAAYPKTKPPYAALLAGPDGAFWVRLYDEPATGLPSTWIVFDSTGAELGPVVLPPSFTAAQIGPSFILGSWKDPDDVEHVRIYRMKPASSH